MKILIIGGSSYVAKSFIEFSQLNSFIQVISRSNTGFINEIVVPDFNLIPETYFENIDVVINCAAIVHQTKQTDPYVYQKVNHHLAVDLAAKAKKNGVKVFVQLSTLAVYGQQTHISKQTLETPNNPYGLSKLQADKALSEMADVHFQVISIRPPMIYGGKNAPGNMIRLIKLHAKGVPLPFRGVNAKRDFIHITNLVHFIDSAIKRGQTDVYLVSDNSSVSIDDLSNIIYRELKMNNRSFRPPSLCLKIGQKLIPGTFDKLFGSLTIDISDTIQKLNFEPNKLIEQGIKEMIE